MVAVFEAALPHIESNGNNLPSNAVLAVIAYADTITAQRAGLHSAFHCMGGACTW